MRKDLRLPVPMAANSIPESLAQACDEVRLAGPADAVAVAGAGSTLVAAPATTQQAGAVLRAASELGLAVIPRGTGSRLNWGYPPERADLIIDTTRMNRVIEHEAGDLVATVQAGIGLDRGWRWTRLTGPARSAACWRPARRDHCGCATEPRVTCSSESRSCARTGRWPGLAARWSRTWPATTSASCSPGRAERLG